MNDIINKVIINRLLNTTPKINPKTKNNIIVTMFGNFIFAAKLAIRNKAANMNMVSVPVICCINSSYKSKGVSTEYGI